VTVFSRLRRRWLHSAFRFMRWSRVLAYAAIAVAGMVAVFLPPRTVEEATGNGTTVQIVWAALMSVAAAFCTWGAATDRWVGEYVGLIPLAAVAAVFGISAMSRGGGGWAGGIFLVGFFWILVSRWQEVALIKAEAERQAGDRRCPSEPVGEATSVTAQTPQPEEEGPTP
jgi:hypothetical protein